MSSNGDVFFWDLLQPPFVPPPREVFLCLEQTIFQESPPCEAYKFASEKLC